MSDPALTHDPPETLAAIHSLDEAMAEPEPLDDWEHPIEPESLSRANRIARGLARSEREEAAVKAAALQQIAEVQTWMDRELDRIGRSKGWFARSLELFVRSHHERGGPKSLRLATGHTLSLSKARGRVEVSDEAAFLAWALGCECGHDRKSHGIVQDVPTNPYAAGVATCMVDGIGGMPCMCQDYTPTAPALVRETAPKPAEQRAAKTEIAKLACAHIGEETVDGERVNVSIPLLDGQKVPGCKWVVAADDAFKIETADG